VSVSLGAFLILFCPFSLLLVVLVLLLRVLDLDLDLDLDLVLVRRRLTFPCRSPDLLLSTLFNPGRIG